MMRKCILINGKVTDKPQKENIIIILDYIPQVVSHNLLIHVMSNM